MKSAKMIGATMLAALAAGALFPAATAAQEPKRIKGPPVYCSTKYDPVCARTVKGVLTTFTNDCAAGQAGAAIILKGVCDKVKCPPAELTVCARKDGKNANYTNSCIAEKAGAAVMLRDNCPSSCADAGPAVCAVDDSGDRLEFKNACQAVLAGARVLHNGKCVAKTTCTQGGIRVCAIGANGLETQFANECLAELANASWLRNGKCEPGMLMRLLRRYRG
ncbi:MAG TPA: hypothetical protein VKT73_05180 [Xanthobacteraceae bacterium]|nr:hypothetical protein [Xanthobacteraceae bacterium]